VVGLPASAIGSRAGGLHVAKGFLHVPRVGNGVGVGF
jgi:hypothetical protein